VVDIIPGGVGGGGGVGWWGVGGGGWGGSGLVGLGSEAGEDDSPKATQERMRFPFQLRCYV